MHVVWMLVFFVLVNMIEGNIVCYHCHQTSKECNNGDEESINVKNCTENGCVIMKYETIMPGRKVLATIRDCASHSQEQLLSKVSPDMRNPAKIIIFHECFTPLCNVATTSLFSKLLVTVGISLQLFVLLR